MQTPEKKEAHIISEIPGIKPLDFCRWHFRKKHMLALSHIKNKRTGDRAVFAKGKSTKGSASASFMARSQSQKLIGNEKEPEMIQTNTQILREILKFRKDSLDELKQNVDSLTVSNQELAKKIQDIEALTAEKVRKLLRQQDVFGTLIGTLEYANHRQMQDMKSKLKKWEAETKVRVNELEQQLTKLKTKINNAQEELNFLSSYMDHEYPIKTLEIADLMRQVQAVKDSSQNELDELEEIRKNVLQTLSKKLMVKSEKVLNVMAKRTILPYQTALMKRTLSNQLLLKQMVQFRVHIDRIKKELPKLRAQVKDLQMKRKDPREVIFANVLLRKPKCTPDMDVILNIPPEEILPF
ncbi:uncharacterized protein C20orf96 homolog [Sminthopsis crassicaudata]|uniref:uncharacterized protein C20orf96 homolog n=1 Tax=Sminthopsis crassicaudata TaxID=9301 RepID=UPI003D683C7A